MWTLFFQMKLVYVPPSLNPDPHPSWHFVVLQGMSHYVICSSGQKVSFNPCASPPDAKGHRVHLDEMWREPDKTWISDELKVRTGCNQESLTAVIQRTGWSGKIIHYMALLNSRRVKSRVWFSTTALKMIQIMILIRNCLCTVYLYNNNIPRVSGEMFCIFSYCNVHILQKKIVMSVISMQPWYHL